MSTYKTRRLSTVHRHWVCLVHRTQQNCRPK